MLTIKKIRADHTIDYAAEELKKYLRMMMPLQGEIEISVDPRAKDGFRLGLLEDFGLPFEGKDAKFDDVVHIETTKDGGVLAGSNPRSVLFAVYRFLKLNGCRFLFPGIEGEYIPMKEIEPQNYHHAASFRFRGHTIEGRPSVEQVLLYIDFHAKEELNAFGCLNVLPYQKAYYSHKYGKRVPEPVDPETADKQWRALYESEVKKRGLLLFSGEHEWLPTAIGFDINERYLYSEGKKEVPEHIRPYLALLNGKRDLHKNNIFYTNVCMSNPKVRTMIADTVVKAAGERRHLDFLGFTVADLHHNHCECEECKKLRPSDWYVMILNEIDEKLTEKGLDTKIVAAMYLDTLFPPAKERFHNPDRFIMQYCPISRSYSTSVSAETVVPPPIEFKYNAWEPVKTSEQAFSMLREWQKVYPGAWWGFEYHFWKPQYRDFGGMDFAKSVYKDVLALDFMELNGYMQDGSNKSFWPNGFAGHIYAETMVNKAIDYEKEQEDFFFHLYGEDWKKVASYFRAITKAFDFQYVQGEKSADPGMGALYNPDMAEPLSYVKELSAEMRDLVKTHMSIPCRPQSTAWRMLLLHAEYCEGLAEVFGEKCIGHNKHAIEMFFRFFEEFGAEHEYELDRLCDLPLAAWSLETLIRKNPLIDVI